MFVVIDAIVVGKANSVGSGGRTMAVPVGCDGVDTVIV
jgi:hypothetical protein